MQAKKIIELVVGIVVVLFVIYCYWQMSVSALNNPISVTGYLFFSKFGFAVLLVIGVELIRISAKKEV